MVGREIVRRKPLGLELRGGYGVLARSADLVGVVKPGGEEGIQMLVKIEIRRITMVIENYDPLSASDPPEPMRSPDGGDKLPVRSKPELQAGSRVGSFHNPCPCIPDQCIFQLRFLRMVFERGCVVREEDRRGRGDGLIRSVGRGVSGRRQREGKADRHQSEKLEGGVRLALRERLGL